MTAMWNRWKIVPTFLLCLSVTARSPIVNLPDLRFRHLKALVSRWHVLLSVLFGIGLLLPLTNGCASLRSPAAPTIRYTEKKAPIFLMKYYPYRPNGFFIAQPVPNYSGWTTERMQRDLRRMMVIGIDGILTVVTPGLLADDFRRGRLEDFIGIAQKTNLKIGLLLEPGPAGATFRRDDLGAWVVDANLRVAPACMKRDGRPLFIIAPGVKLEGPNHPAIALLHTNSLFHEWRWPRPNASGRWKLGRPGDQILVRAGFRGANGVVDDQKTWILPRYRGRTLQKQLWRAFDRRALTICISSWNDFTRGDFVEPNSLDGQAVYDLLALEIDRARSKIVNEVQRAMMRARRRKQR